MEVVLAWGETALLTVTLVGIAVVVMLIRVKLGVRQEQAEQQRTAHRR